MIFGADLTIESGAGRYVLNSAVCTTEGTFHYQIVDLRQATAWLEMGSFVSYIGYDEVARALEDLTGIEIPVNRKSVFMRVHEQALVFRLIGFRPNSADKYRLKAHELRGRCEMGILTKVAPSLVLPSRRYWYENEVDTSETQTKTGW